MGPQNGIMGDNFGTELPETKVPEDDLSREQSMARFSKTTEFKALKVAIEERITYFQQYVPGGNGTAIAVDQLPNDERGWRWLASDMIIKELKGIIGAYEQANEVLKNAAAGRKGA